MQRAFALATLAAMASATPVRPRGPPGNKGVIVQMFQWNWDSIAEECTQFLGPAGYGFVQTSPPQEHIQGDPWFTDYQPVSYNIISKRGDRSQFKNMIDTCHAAGVQVIADAVINHMAGVESGVGVGGSSFTHYDYPGIYQVQDFHHCGLTPNDGIENFGDRQQVQTCQLVGLADLATDTEYVQGRIAQYLNDLLSLGVDGLRIDAVKHMAASDVAAIVGRLSRGTYLTQEVIFGAGEPIQPSEYAFIGDVQEFRYTFTFKDAFLNGGIANLQGLPQPGMIDGLGANVFVANHDTEREGSSLRFDSPSNTYTLAMVLSLGHPYASPTILSSYVFTDKDAGAPNQNVGTCFGDGGVNGWLCQHRFPAVAGMTRFRNSVATADMRQIATPTSQRLAFGRGTSGFVAINNEDGEWADTFKSSLQAGTYCDVISGGKVDGACKGGSVTVGADGTFQTTISPRNAIGIHVGERL